MNESQSKALGMGSLLGADIIDGFNTAADENMRSASIQRRQDEMASRGIAALAEIDSKSDAVAGAQEIAFASSGVKMEGSALNVVSDTYHNALEAKQAKQQEISYRDSQLEVERILSEKRASFAATDTIMAMGSTYASASAK